MAQPEQTESIGSIAQANWLSEMQCIGVYVELLRKERNGVRRTVIQKLRQAEERHVRLWADLLNELGEEKPPTESVPAFVEKITQGPGGTVSALKAIEEEERRDVAEYSRQLREIDDDRLASILRDIIPDEHAHALILRRMISQPDARSALDRALRKERRGAGGWIGDAVYGVNDGLGAIFGIVSGVSGATLGDRRVVLLAGLAGMFASALSMGAGAYLAAKSERELYDAEIFHERLEYQEHPEDCKEELSLFYQLRGVPEAEADSIAERMAKNEDQFVKGLAAEKLSITAEALSNPISSMFTGSISTAIGAFIPVLPFFFIGGFTAVVLAASISLIAHFLVGAAKSLVTVRSWWASGLEMTAVGLIEGVITYAIGLALGHFTNVQTR